MADGYNHKAPVTVIYVGQMTGLGDAGTQRVVGANDYWVLGYRSGSMDKANFGGWVEDTSMAADTNPHLYVGTIGGSGTDSTFYRDGAVVASNQNGTTGPNNLQLAGSDIWYEVSDCEVAEVLVYNRVLSSEELTSVGTFLNQKYFVTTPTLTITGITGPDPSGNFTIAGTASPSAKVGLFRSTAVNAPLTGTDWTQDGASQTGTSFSFTGTGGVTQAFFILKVVP